MKEDRGRRFWDRFAFLYSFLHMRRNRELYDEVVSHTLPYLKETDRVLELACGTGELSEVLAEHVSSWTATDRSGKMIGQARRRRTGKAVFEVADAMHLPYEDGSFDVIFIANALHVVPEPSAMLSEAGRCLKPSGVLIAPVFAYEGKISRTRIALMKAAGFVTYSKWTSVSYREWMEAQGWHVSECTLIPGSMLPECFLSATR